MKPLATIERKVVRISPMGEVLVSSSMVGTNPLIERKRIGFFGLALELFNWWWHVNAESKRRKAENMINDGMYHFREKMRFLVEVEV